MQSKLGESGASERHQKIGAYFIFGKDWDRGWLKSKIRSRRIYLSKGGSLRIVLNTEFHQNRDAEEKRGFVKQLGGKRGEQLLDQAAEMESPGREIFNRVSKKGGSTLREPLLNRVDTRKDE